MKKRESRPLLGLLLLGAFLVQGCDDCEKVDLPICGIQAPAQSPPDTPIPLTVTYELSGCVDVKSTTHTLDATRITIHGRGDYCCKDCMCALGIEKVEHTLPGLEPGLYRIKAALGASQTCDATRDGPKSLELLVQ